MPAVNSTCDPRFTSVRTAFARNFNERGELGSALTVLATGRVVVDLWGGWADQAAGRPWQPDTLVNVFSVGQDQLALRQRLSHQAGLPAVRRELPPGAALDWPVMTAALAAQEPWWEPGTGHGYHVNTFGSLTGEVIRRVTGVTVGEYLRAEITGPLGADVHIGRDGARLRPGPGAGPAVPARPSASSSPSPNVRSVPARPRSATSARAARSASPTPTPAWLSAT